MSAFAVVLVMGLCGAGLLIAGTYLLAGTGAAMIVAGVMCFGSARFVRSGMRPTNG